MPADSSRSSQIPDEDSILTVPMAARHSAVAPRRIGRRRVLSTGGILLTCSVAGLLTGASTALAIHAWGTMATSGKSQTAPVSRPPAPLPTIQVQQQFRFVDHTALVHTLAWSPDGTTMASAGDDGILLLWRTEGEAIGQRVSLPAAVHSVAWSPDGLRLVAGSGPAVAFIDTQTGQVLAQHVAHQAAVSSVAWSQSPGFPVVSGSLDRTAVVWQTQGYQPQGRFRRHTAPIESVAVAPQGAIVASASQGGVIRVWALGSLQEVHGFLQDTTSAMLSAAFAPDGQRLAVGGQDGIVRLWGNAPVCQAPVAAGGGERQCADVPMRLRGHTAPVRTVMWSPDGRVLSTGGDDGEVILWDSATGTQMTKMTHAAPVTAMGWSPRGQLLATASGSVVTIWTARTVKA